MFKRKLSFEKGIREPFFLWGPRQTGKTTLLKSTFKDSFWIDLLKSDQYRKFMQSPHLLREIVQADASIKHVVIDEIQKVPDLLDEIHWLMENTDIDFALCGSSARKLKRGHANLLGGRAIRYELRRTVQSPKFYFSDVGVVNFLCKRGFLEPGSELFGKAFENWVYHELHTYNAYSESFADLSYWRLSSGIEVDFVVDDFRLAVEAKATQKVKSDHLKGLRHLKTEVDSCKQRIIVCLESVRRMTDDGILILPYQDFINDLWKGELFT